MSEDVFCRIIRGEIPAEVYYETDLVLAIKNINPEAPFHALIIPKKHLELDAVSSEEKTVLGELFMVAKEIAKKGSDYKRLSVNR